MVKIFSICINEHDSTEKKDSLMEKFNKEIDNYVDARSGVTKLRWYQSSAAVGTSPYINVYTRITVIATGP